MRLFMAAAILALLAGPAYAQMPPMGIPMGGPDKPERPVDPVKENEYNSAIKGLPTQKADPWGSVRTTTTPTPAPAPAAKKTPADKKAAPAKKDATTAKNADPPKKTD